MSWFSRWFSHSRSRRPISPRRTRPGLEILGDRLVPSATLFAHADLVADPTEFPVAAFAHEAGLQDVFWSVMVVSLLGPVDARASFARPLALSLGSVANDLLLVDDIFTEDTSTARASAAALKPGRPCCFSR